MPEPPASNPLPYKIAVLCYLYDDRGRVLLLHRKQNPNLGMYSPVGGKLHMETGEGPHDCAVREIEEETGIRVDPRHVRLAGIVTEAAYEGRTHWMMFLFEVTRPIEPAEVKWTDFSEGTLEWVELERVASLAIPETDRRVMWPAVQRHRGGFFMTHIDCTGENLRWEMWEERSG